jgi:hypothetical protein
MKFTKGIKHKYNAKPTVVDGFRFDSKKEAMHYKRNLILIQSGIMLMQVRQVPFHLPGGVIYRLDFMEVYKDGEVRWIDVKGMDTPQSKQKRKQVVEWRVNGIQVYPIEITLI